MRIQKLEPRWVDFVPKVLESGVLYISTRYQTASHLCACGCGERVVTPLSPAKWQLRAEGAGNDVVSLFPSIGNWDYACRSHYWIRRNAIHWSGDMSEAQVARVKAKDRAAEAGHIAATNRMKDEATRQRKPSTITRFLSWLTTMFRG